MVEQKKHCLGSIFRAAEAIQFFRYTMAIVGRIAATVPDNIQNVQSCDVPGYYVSSSVSFCWYISGMSEVWLIPITQLGKSVCEFSEKGEQKISTHPHHPANKKRDSNKKYTTSSAFHFTIQSISSYFVIEFLYQFQCAAYSFVAASIAMSVCLLITIISIVLGAYSSYLVGWIAEQWALCTAFSSFAKCDCI